MSIFRWHLIFFLLALEARPEADAWPVSREAMSAWAGQPHRELRGVPQRQPHQNSNDPKGWSSTTFDQRLTYPRCLTKDP